MKVKNAIKKVGAVAASTLMAGLTLGTAATLAEFPGQYVDDDGTPTANIVVGSQGAVTDVVGAINVAAAVGQSTLKTETQTKTESVSVEGGSAGWSAENGLTLNRRNSNLFVYDNTAAGQTRLDETDLNILETSTFMSADSNEVEIEHDLEVGEQAQEFAAEGDYDDPILHVNNPTSLSSTSNLFMATAEFNEAIDFTTAGDGDDVVDGDEYIEDGDEIELFGNEFTFSDETDTNEIVLYGESERTEVNTGESRTIEVEGEEVEIEAVYVSDSSPVEATISINGQTESAEEGDTVGPNGNLRVSDIYRTGPEGQGRVAVSAGSEELILEDGGDVSVDGTTLDAVETDIDGNINNMEEITFYFGAEDNDEDFIEAGDMYEDPIFGMRFHYGGLNPDTADEESADEVVELDVSEDSTADMMFTTADGDEATISLAEATSDAADGYSFGDEDGTIAEYEGQTVSEDDFVVLNAFSESDVYEVTDVSDADIGASDTEGEVSVTLENVASGDSVTVEEDGIDFSTESAPYTLQDESIEGKDYDVTFEDGGDVNFVRSVDEPTQIWPSMYTSTDAAVAFVNDDSPVDLDTVLGDVAQADFSGTDDSGSVDAAATTSGSSTDVDVAISGGTGTSADLKLYDSNGNNIGEASSVGTSTTTVTTNGTNVVEEVEVTSADGTVDLVNVSETDDATNFAEFGSSSDPIVSEVVKTAELPSGVASNDAEVTWTFDSVSDYSAATMNKPSFVQYTLNHPEANTLEVAEGDSAAKILFAQPENDDDNEEAYALDITLGTNDASIDSTYTGGQLDGGTLDNEDVDVAYDDYGAYSMEDYDSSDSEVFTLHMPAAQATAGMAMTGPDGALSTSGASGGEQEVSVEYTGITNEDITGNLPNLAMTDQDVTSSVRQNSDLILVGGPAVNTLVADLADAGKTWTLDAWRDEHEDEALLQVVEDAFTDGQKAMIVAGYAAEDSLAAAQYISNYAAHQDELDTDQLTLTQSMYPGQ